MNTDLDNLINQVKIELEMLKINFQSSPGFVDGAEIWYSEMCNRLGLTGWINDAKYTYRQNMIKLAALALYAAQKVDLKEVRKENLNEHNKSE